MSDTLRNLRKAEKLLVLGGVGRGRFYSEPEPDALLDNGLSIGFYGTGYCSVGAIAAVRTGVTREELNDDEEDILDNLSRHWPEVQALADTIFEHHVFNTLERDASEVVVQFNDDFPAEKVREIWRETIERLETQQ